jgi:hypothetical protein
MNIDVLIYGLVSVFLGLILLIIKTKLNGNSYMSYTGVYFIFGTYLLLVVGSLLIFLSFFY